MKKSEILKKMKKYSFVVRTDHELRPINLERFQNLGRFSWNMVIRMHLGRFRWNMVIWVHLGRFRWNLVIRMHFARFRWNLVIRGNLVIWLFGIWSFGHLDAI